MRLFRTAVDDSSLSKMHGVNVVPQMVAWGDFFYYGKAGIGPFVLNPLRMQFRKVLVSAVCFWVPKQPFL